jgi:Family of unknown function (DUF6502)
MGRNSKLIALSVAKSTFEGLAPILFESGVMLPEAEKLLRAVCVHAMAKQRQSGRRVLNDSQLSIRIGVDRHDVAKLLKRPPMEGVEVSPRQAAVTRVIRGWEAECRTQGRKRELAVGDFQSVGPSVWTLVQRYAPGIYPRGIIDEMLRVKLVRQIKSGQLRLEDQVLSKAKPNAHDLEQATQRIQDVIRAIFHDFANPRAKSVFQEVLSEQVDVADLPLVRKMLAERIDSLMERLAEELNSPRLKRGPSTGRKVRLGAVSMIIEQVLAKESDDESAGGAKDGEPRNELRKRSRVKDDKSRSR